MKRSLLLTLLISLLYLNAYAEMYKWVDEEGNIQYTQTPPPAGTEATAVKPPPVHTVTIPSSAAGTAKSKSTQKVDEKKDEKKADGDTEQPSDAAHKNKDPLAANCEKAQKELQLLASEQELMAPDKENPGKYVTITPEMRQQKTARAQAYLDENCKKETKETAK